MKFAVISYDLMNVTGGDNERVRSALLAFVNTYAGLHAYNSLSPFMQHVVLDMPETTITAEIIGAASSVNYFFLSVTTIIPCFSSLFSLFSFCFPAAQERRA